MRYLFHYVEVHSKSLTQLSHMRSAKRTKHQLIALCESIHALLMRHKQILSQFYSSSFGVMIIATRHQQAMRDFLSNPPSLQNMVNLIKKIKSCSSSKLDKKQQALIIDSLQKYVHDFYAVYQKFSNEEQQLSFIQAMKNLVNQTHYAKLDCGRIVESPIALPTNNYQLRVKAI